MKLRTSDLTPGQLNWLVARIEGSSYMLPHSNTYCTNPAQSWPIIERLLASGFTLDKASFSLGYKCHAILGDAPIVCGFGKTGLIAAMSAWAIFKLGDEVDVPGVLL